MGVGARGRDARASTTWTWRSHYKEELEIRAARPPSACAALSSRKAVDLKEKFDQPGNGVEDYEKMEKELEAAWHEVIAAYKLGVANRSFTRRSTTGRYTRRWRRSTSRGAMLELGDVEGAKKFVDEAVVAFPENSALKVMQKHVDKQLAKEV